VLVLEPRARLACATQTGLLAAHCAAHARGWYALAEDQGLLVENGDLFLIYGVVTTAAWAVAAYSEQAVALGATSTPGPAPPQERATLQWERREWGSPHHRSGPHGAHTEQLAEQARAAMAESSDRALPGYIDRVITQPENVYLTSANMCTSNTDSSARKDPSSEDRVASRPEEERTFDQTLFLRHMRVLFRHWPLDPEPIDGTAGPDDFALFSAVMTLDVLQIRE
jgi:hypothetical protein